MKEPVWIPLAAVRAIHLELIAEYGGLPGIRDQNLLESALARPRHLFAYEDPDLYELAAAYAYGFARNHPFVDGNKRMAMASIAVFLELTRRNGHTLTAEKADAIETMLELARGKLAQRELAEWIRRNSRAGRRVAYSPGKASR